MHHPPAPCDPRPVSAPIPTIKTECGRGWKLDGLWNLALSQFRDNNPRISHAAGTDPSNESSPPPSSKRLENGWSTHKESATPAAELTLALQCVPYWSIHHSATALGRPTQLRTHPGSKLVRPAPEKGSILAPVGRVSNQSVAKGCSAKNSIGVPTVAGQPYRYLSDTISVVLRRWPVGRGPPGEACQNSADG